MDSILRQIFGENHIQSRRMPCESPSSSRLWPNNVTKGSDWTDAGRKQCSDSSKCTTDEAPRALDREEYPACTPP
ncbi:hypothetical protein T265_08687 [Opisthorchis viverrini]|uniref:Uncharacterized protein n=1 Tax=Opisthorchis viverrini TaxID=6198 RepID=A0A075A7H4_OPIVI|nr:hypothetical protein T265_08687 [Opisthorchis viverrini]KER23414.1 hypothetical protein T265_08687 [Opisthorchis viverrini]